MVVLRWGLLLVAAWCVAVLYRAVALGLTDQNWNVATTVHVVGFIATIVYAVYSRGWDLSRPEGTKPDWRRDENR